MRITKITIPRRLVQDAVGDAPKRIVKSTKRLSESSSSAGNESQEHRVVENRSISRRFNSSDASSEKLSKRSSSSSKGISPKQSAKDLVITSHSQPTIVPPKRKHNTAASKSLLMRPHAREQSKDTMSQSTKVVKKKTGETSQLSHYSRKEK